MELVLERKWRTEQSTIGELSLGGKFVCYILEDYDRGLKASMSLKEIEKVKVKHETAIPLGRYEVTITVSQRFKRALPLLLGVPGYEGIRIHTGNTKADTSGCLLPGKKKGTNQVFESTAAFNELFKLIGDALLNEKVYITVK